MADNTNKTLKVENEIIRSITVDINSDGTVNVSGFDNLDKAISDLEYGLRYLYIRKELALTSKK